MIHLKGFIHVPSDPEENGVRLSNDKDNFYSPVLSDRIAQEIEEYIESAPSKHQPREGMEFEDGVEISLNVPSVALRIYATENISTLEQAQKKVVLNTLGALDIYQEWVGYSEYTVTGYDVINFSIGGHDLDKIFKSYENKYVHILIELRDGEPEYDESARAYELDGEFNENN